MPLSLLGSVLRQQNPSPAAVHGESASENPNASPKPTPDSMKIELGAPFTSPAPSRPGTPSSTASVEKPKKRAPRPKTIYNLALPPPSSNPKKLSIRPKILLQLHQVVASRRPKPVYEVIPYSILDTSRRLVRTFNSRKLCPTDILIVKSADYETNSEAKSDDEPWGARDVIAVICPDREEKSSTARAELLLDNGQTWEVTTTHNGGYEFNHTDDHGLALKSRWVPKPSSHTRQKSSMSTNSLATPSPPEDRKFKFSTISSKSRRHPVIATLTRSRIEIHDSYVIPTATSPPTPSQPGSALPTPIATPTTIDLESFMDNANEQLSVTTDDALRRFIVISGVWVSFCENWSPSYSSRAAGPSPLNTAATFRPYANRTVSMPFIESPRSASPASTVDENRRSIPRIIRTSVNLHRNASFSEAAPAQQSPVTSPTKTRPNRSNSTGTADLIRSGSTKKRFSLALGEHPLTETDEERQAKRSCEIMRIKELSLPPTSALNSPTHALTPIPSLEPSLTRTISPVEMDSRGRKTKSAYDPVPTAGLWDSGVVEGGGLKTRPTSMVVVNEKKMKAKKKEDRSKSKDKRKDRKESCHRKSDGIRHLFVGMFRKEKRTD
ncbi:hypothetical protein P280DRAFT_467931 [Massarina eburnea CBS 473.64]|uniref:Uncharacterized protein n=1 Tax=Massarina eburnea CBS 473.64 TaxID=1395130 RepID=A0A6A6S782_9PLEO|nr:hypothetical protein P280DRAFT_467931 [Massarina eburnea CBS 473.64]